MTPQHLIQFGPLIVAAYVVITTSLFLAAVNLLAARSKLLSNVSLLYTLSSVGPFIWFAQWYVNAIGIDLDKGICSGDQVGQMLTLIVLGFFLPAYGVFGVVALNCPSFWQRYSALRTQPKQAV